MKNILRDSRIIRWYIRVVCALIVGFLLTFIFSGKLSFARYIAAGGFVLGSLCFILLVLNMGTIDKEIRARYVSATHSEKRFLDYLFYFAWGQCLFLGLIIWGLTLSHEGVSDKNMVEVKGEISEVSVYGNKKENLKILLVGNSNDYEIRTHLIWYKTLEQIENELRRGMPVYLTIHGEDQNRLDDPYIEIYGIRTETHTYFSLKDYQREEAQNNTVGMFLGIAFTVLGIVLVLQSRWEFQKYLKLHSYPY